MNYHWAALSFDQKAAPESCQAGRQAGMVSEENSSQQP
jgi:hypothetical protein